MASECWICCDQSTRWCAWSSSSLCRDMPPIVSTLNAPMAKKSKVIRRKAARSLRWTVERTPATQRTRPPIGVRRRKAASRSGRSSRIERREYTPRA